MTISYNWLSEYLPQKEDPARLSTILTSIGLEVESLEAFEEIPGGLSGLLVGEIMSCEQHPGADKLKVTLVSIGGEDLLKIVCGAANVAAGQKVVVAPVGTTIHPVGGESVTLKKASIRGTESEGMICAEDEIGLGNSHAGILILPPETVPGSPVAEIFKPYQDFIFEIGLTPNRMDAMSHLGVAKDICAWLSYHNKKEIVPLFPYPASFAADGTGAGMEVIIEDPKACRRYSGISISGITVADSPLWMKQKLQAIGLKPINNIVDITNFILHETGQPLHAFDADKISGNKIIVKKATDAETFRTLDDKERKLFAGDLLICNEHEAMCLAGIYGGMNSGVTSETKNIFLESAWFDPATIRKTSLKHSLRTDAATRFEKGVDISNTVNVLKRAALLICELGNGKITGDIIDNYPAPLEKKIVGIPYNYLRKLSGKKYEAEDVRRLLQGLGFVVANENTDELCVEVPFSKPDITLPADIVEEIMRIDGLDNIEIPGTISISPSVEKDRAKTGLKEKTAAYLTGLGFSEIFTNSITNSAFYDKDELEAAVKMINNLSADLDIMRPQMMQGGLQVIAHNINRKNTDLKLFEFGKTYASVGNKYHETNHLSLYVTGNNNEQHWKIKPVRTDIYHLKGALERVLQLAGIRNTSFEVAGKKSLKNAAVLKAGSKELAYLGEVETGSLKQFDVKNAVFYADVNWDDMLLGRDTDVIYQEVSKFPLVTRDLALVVDKNVSYNQVEGIALAGKIWELKSVQLFDVFESEKLGTDKKSMAVSFTFLDEAKTLTDKEIDTFMQKIIASYETSLGAEIRK